MKTIIIGAIANPEVLTALVIVKKKFPDCVVVDTENLEDELSELKKDLKAHAILLNPNLWGQVDAEVVDQLKDLFGDSEEAVTVLSDPRKGDQIGLPMAAWEFCYENITPPLVLSLICGKNVDEEDEAGQDKVRYMRNALVNFLMDISDVEVVDKWNALIDNDKRLNNPGMQSTAQDVSLLNQLVEDGKRIDKISPFKWDEFLSSGVEGIEPIEELLGKVSVKNLKAEAESLELPKSEFGRKSKDDLIVYLMEEVSDDALRSAVQKYLKK